jgi:manganese/zinc/iron transport system substrate-binding protein
MDMFWRWFLILLSGILVVFSGPIVQAGETWNITCTTGMVADIVRNVAGDRAKVTQLMGAGVDPHLYQATRSDIAALLRSDVIFFNGLMLEGKMADALIKVSQKVQHVYQVTDLDDKSFLLEPPEFAGHYDPHVWMDPSIWKRCAEVVADSMAEFDPPNGSVYRANYEAYASKLDGLDAYSKRCFKSIPEKSRVLVTAHDAFNYLGRAYGLEVKGIQGISTESEAGIEDINRLVDMLVQRQVGAVFVETSVSDRNVRSLIEGAGSRGHQVKIGGDLFSDAMGRPGSYEGTYIGMIDHNVTVITRALGGEAPKRGMNGQLTAEH